MTLLEERQKKHIFYTWTAQNDAHGLEMTRAEGAEFWTADGTHWIDFESQVFNAHLGHGESRVIDAIHRQAEVLAVAHPAAIFETKARLGERLAELTPQGMNRFFLTLGGSEGNENALKIARMVTGRQKVISRYNSYHGATSGALTLTGDRRRTPFEPGIPGVVHVPPPDCFRCPWGKTPDSCDVPCAHHLIQTAQFEGPETLAAIFVEPIGGAVGGYMPPPSYLQELRSFCDAHGILLVADEVLTGFGRTGKWFAVEHSEVVPDMMVMAKGLTAGYAPLGALGVQEHIAQHFDEEMLWAGLTSYAHPMSCAAALATIEVMLEDGLIERSAALGVRMQERFDRMTERFACIGEARAKGLYGVIELVQGEGTRSPLVPEGASGAEAAPTAALRAALRTLGVHMAVKGPRAFIAPPLMIPESVLMEGLDRFEEALSIGIPE